MLSQGVQHQGIGLQSVDGLLQGVGQRVDAVSFSGGGIHVEDVLGDLRGRGEALLDAVQPGGQTESQLQVGVAGRVGREK